MLDLNENGHIEELSQAMTGQIVRPARSWRERTHRSLTHLRIRVGGSTPNIVPRFPSSAKCARLAVRRLRSSRDDVFFV